MRRIAAVVPFAALASASLVSIVNAADMGPSPVLRGPMPMTEQATDWTGFYVGGFGGFNQMEFEPRQASQGLVREMLRSTIWLNPGRADDIVAYKRNTSNAIGYGIYMGYNFQVEDYIMGVEADYTRGKLDGSSVGGRSGGFALPDFTTAPRNEYRYVTSTTSRLKISEFGTIRGRIGMPMGSFLPFVTAGIGLARLSYGNTATMTGETRDVTINIATGLPNPPGPWGPAANYSLQDGSRTRFAFGYALGAGMDWAVTQNVVMRAELMHVRFGNAGDTSASINTARAGAALKF